ATSPPHHGHARTPYNDAPPPHPAAHPPTPPAPTPATPHASPPRLPPTHSPVQRPATPSSLTSATTTPSRAWRRGLPKSSIACILWRSGCLQKGDCIHMGSTYR